MQISQQHHQHDDESSFDLPKSLHEQQDLAPAAPAATPAPPAAAEQEQGHSRHNASHSAGSSSTTSSTIDTARAVSGGSGRDLDDKGHHDGSSSSSSSSSSSRRSHHQAAAAAAASAGSTEPAQSAQQELVTARWPAAAATSMVAPAAAAGAGNTSSVEDDSSGRDIGFQLAAEQTAASLLSSAPPGLASSSATHQQGQSQKQQQQQQQQRQGKRGGKRKLLVILHGKRIDDDQIRAAITTLKGEGHQVHVRVTFDSGDVDQFVKEALELWEQQEYNTLVAGGGDGTLNELVAALLKHQQQQQQGGGLMTAAAAGGPPWQQVNIAQLPLGTANDLASATGISLDPLEALRLALDPSTVHPIDVALVNGEVFMNLATAGPVSEVSSKDMNSTLKKVLGPAAVAVAGLRQLFVTGLSPIKGVRITYPTSLTARLDSYSPDQVASITGDLLVLVAGQARQMGRMVNLCPEALLDDSLLDFTLGFGSAWQQVTALASGLVMGTTGEEDSSSSSSSHTASEVKLLRLPWLILEADTDIKCNRDGEPSSPSKRLVFEVLPRCINMHLPDSRLLLEGNAPAVIASSADDVAETADEPGRQIDDNDDAGAAAKAAAAARSSKKGQGGHQQQQQQRSKQHWPPALQKAAKKLMSTGHRPTRRLLKALWQAQQPPGRLSRMIPRIKKLVGQTLVYAGLLAAGFALGYQAQQLVDFSDLPGFGRITRSLNRVAAGQDDQRILVVLE